MNRKWGLLAVALTLAAWGCFQGMEAVPDHTPLSTALFVGGYALVAIALYAFYHAVRISRT